MSFHLPRRHRRRLLLPPGLVALAGLLLLGCLALRPWQEWLTRRSVIELNMMPRPVSDQLWPRPDLSPDCLWPKSNGPKLRSSNLANFRNWTTFEFGLDKKVNALRTRQIDSMLSSIGPNPNWENNGLRISFGPGAHYDSIVGTLNLMNRHRVSQYFIDIYHTPVTLYTFTMKRQQCMLMPK